VSAPLNLIASEISAPTATIGVHEDPNTGVPTAPLLASEPAVVERGLAAAWRAWGRGTGPFSARALPDRLALLGRFAAQLDARAEALAQAHACEVGIPITTARLFAGGVAGVIEEVAATAPSALAPTALANGARQVDIHRLPWGPAALYVPWNAPAFVAATKLATALAAGCPAILKPSEHTPQTTGLIVDALVEADIGPSAVQVVCGGADVGAQLALDARVRMISYTGGTAGGRAVAAAAIARMTPMQLELSASNPAVVLPGADLEHAARELARGSLVLNGQWCEAPRRVYVDAAAHDALAALIAAELAHRTVGSSLDEATEVGPLAHRAQYESVARETERLAALGDAVAADADVPDGGFFLSPTVVAGLALDAVRAEIFGPVLALSPYRDVEAALGAANALDDGLAAYVFGPDRDAAHEAGRRLHAGEVRVGGCRVLDLAPGSAQAFWGASGLGGHGRAATLLAHVGARIVGDEDEALIL
jgi:acyl-CoA reductase-like NAD-dependent aldehyde dehydrogenase